MSGLAKAKIEICQSGGKDIQTTQEAWEWLLSVERMDWKKFNKTSMSRQIQIEMCPPAEVGGQIYAVDIRLKVFIQDLGFINARGSSLATVVNSVIEAIALAKE